MSDHWLFGTLISVDVQHQELLRGFGVLLLIPFAVFLLSYVRVSFAFIKDRARKGALDTVTRVLAALLMPLLCNVPLWQHFAVALGRNAMNSKAFKME